jgi:hypothetical protein
VHLGEGLREQHRVSRCKYEDSDFPTTSNTPPGAGGGGRGLFSSTHGLLGRQTQAAGAWLERKAWGGNRW